MAQQDNFRVQREVQKSIAILSHNLSLFEEKVSACKRIHKYGEAAQIELLRVISETNDRVVSLCCNALLMSLGEKPVCNFFEVISDSGNSKVTLRKAIRALVAVNNHASRTILLEIYNQNYDLKRLNKLILKELAELGDKYILEVFVRQMLVRDDRAGLQEYIRTMIHERELVNQSNAILRNIVRFSIDSKEVRLAFLNLYNFYDSLIDNQITALVAEGNIDMAIQKYSIRLS